MGNSYHLDLARKYAARHYHFYPVTPVSGMGIWVIDADGKIYLDACAGYSAGNFGHSYKKIIDLASSYFKIDDFGWGPLGVVPNNYPNPNYAEFLKYSCKLLGFDKALMANSGAEAVEAAIKLMRAWGYRKKKKPVSANEAVIVVCDNNFHGRTTTIISFSSKDKYKNYFGPLTPGFIFIPYGDSLALESALRSNENIVGFLVEPIQGEGGIIIPPDGYLKKCYDLCKEYDIIFCADEIQTGLGRTGHLLASHHDEVSPDIVILGKSLGAGIAPVSAVFSKEEFMVFEPGEHGSTYGGNSFSSMLALQSLRLMEEEALVWRSKRVGDYFLSLLKNQLFFFIEKYKLIKEIRGRGLMIGIELSSQINNDLMTEAVIKALLNHGVLTNTANGVIRITPPLTILHEDCSNLVNRIGFAFEELKELVCSE